MSYHSVRPETALRRANDLMSLGKNLEALEALNSLVASKRHQTWTVKHEEAMSLYVSLAIQLKKNIKVALVQFRTNSQQSVFEKVTRDYLNLLWDATEEAAKKAEGEQVVDLKPVEAQKVIEDDEVGFILEEQIYFVNGVGGEDAEERNKRKILSPWLKYQWDSYRTILDVLKNNNRLEALYHEVVEHALKFCGRFNRTSDFKKLCDILRMHFQTIEKYQGQSHTVSLASGESIQSYLKTRFLQLNQACEMNVWNEALSIIENISSLQNRGISLGFDAFNLELFNTFHQRLVQIFWAAENYAYHAYALRQLFLNFQAQTARNSEMKDGSSLDDQLALVASQAVLAALIVPADIISDESKVNWSMEIDDSAILGDILQFDEYPSRSNLISAIVDDGILSYAFPSVQTIFQELEYGVSPYRLFSKIDLALEELKMNESLTKFIEPLYDIGVEHLLQRLAKSFETISFEKLSKLVPSVDFCRIEKMIMELSKSRDFHVRIDHRYDLFHFSDFDIYGSRFYSQLKDVSLGLSQVSSMIETKSNADGKKQERNLVFNFITQGLAEEQSHYLTRFRLIELRREIAEKKERMRMEQEKARQLREEQERQRDMAIRKKLKEEEDAKALAAKKRKEEELKAKMNLVADLKDSSSSLAPSVSKKLEEIADNIESMGKEELIKVQTQVLDEERKVQARKQHELEKKLDYFVRAQRIEEIPKIQQRYEEEKLRDKDHFETQFQKMLDDHKARFDESTIEKQRLTRLIPAKDNFFREIMSSRFRIYREERDEQVKRLKKTNQEIEQERTRQKEEKVRKEQEEQERIRKQEETTRKEQEALENLKKKEQIGVTEKPKNLTKTESFNSANPSADMPEFLRKRQELKKSASTPVSSGAPGQPVVAKPSQPVDAKEAHGEVSKSSRADASRDSAKKEAEVPEFLRQRLELKKSSSEAVKPSSTSAVGASKADASRDSAKKEAEVPEFLRQRLELKKSSSEAVKPSSTSAVGERPSFLRQRDSLKANVSSVSEAKSSSASTSSDQKPIFLQQRETLKSSNASSSDIPPSKPLRSDDDEVTTSKVPAGSSNDNPVEEDDGFQQVSSKKKSKSKGSKSK